MMSRPHRYLFQVRNRRGLGHMMRGLNIAREIHAIEAQAEILFYLRTPPSAGFWRDPFAYVVESDPEGLAHWPEVLVEFQPDVVVYDTMLPADAAAEPVAAGARYAYVMRKCLDDEQQAVFANPFLGRMDAILIPHVPEQFGYVLPPGIVDRTRYVGPIVRLPEASLQAMLREKYGIAPGDFVLTSTVGGGGFGPQADAFFDTVFDVHRRLYGRLRDFRHLVVQGPNYSKTLAALPGMTVIAFEPEMINLLALSDLVIAEGGYNTVNEIRVTRTPAIFLPSERGKDNQYERVQAFADAGLGFVFAPGDGAAIAGRVQALHHEPAALAAIRDRYADDHVALGNRGAAQVLIELAGGRP